MSRNIFSTDIDRDNFCYPEKPEDARHLRWMLLTGILIGASCVLAIVLIAVNADQVDRFLSTRIGALMIFSVFASIGIWWLVWRIKKWME